MSNNSKTPNRKYSDKTCQLLFDASEIIIVEMDCYKKSSEKYIEGMRIAKELKKLLTKYMKG